MTMIIFYTSQTCPNSHLDLSIAYC